MINAVAKSKTASSPISIPKLAPKLHKLAERESSRSKIADDVIMIDNDQVSSDAFVADSDDKTKMEVSQSK